MTRNSSRASSSLAHSFALAVGAGCGPRPSGLAVARWQTTFGSAPRLTGAGRLGRAPWSPGSPQRRGSTGPRRPASCPPPRP
eukprot:6269844-Alexandrium_andersonii.AAC.1